MRRVAVDTQILIWGLQGNATANRVELIPRAQQLFDDLEEQKAEVIISAVTVAEYLVGVDDSAVASVMAVFPQKFQIYSFDAMAAVVAARLWKRYNALKDELHKPLVQGLRQTVKADIQIIATAIVNRAECLYVDDPWLERLCPNEILIGQMPPIRVPPQLTLLEVPREESK